MNHGFARIAAVSLRVRLGNVEENEAEILAAMKRLEAQGVQAAVFPELCLTGYTLGDLLQHPLVQRRALEALERLAKASGAMAVAVGLPLTAQGRLYNCAAVLQGGQVRGIVPKTHLAEGQEYYEARCSPAGPGPPARLPFPAAKRPLGPGCSLTWAPSPSRWRSARTFGLPLPPAGATPWPGRR